MPQMSPLNWLFLFMYFIMMVMLIISFVFFIYLSKFNVMLDEKKLMYNMYWMW